MTYRIESSELENIAQFKELNYIVSIGKGMFALSNIFYLYLYLPFYMIYLLIEDYQQWLKSHYSHSFFL